MKEVLRAEPVLYGMPNDTDFALCTLLSALFLIFIKRELTALIFCIGHSKHTFQSVLKFRKTLILFMNLFHTYRRRNRRAVLGQC